MQNVFLDCGSNLGQAYEYFLNIYPNTEWEYKLFEPNPNCYNVLVQKYGSHPDTQIFNTAAYINSDPIEFTYANEFDVGGSIVPKHNSNFGEGYCRPFSTTVQTTNLLDLINDNYAQNKKTILKLDVESSEYDIMEALINSGVIFKLEKIYCEFHSIWMNETDRAEYAAREHAIINFVVENNINCIYNENHPPTLEF